MIAMKNSVTQMYAKGGEADDQENGRISSMSMTMTKMLRKTLKTSEKQARAPKPYQGPHVAGFAVDKQVMPVVTNDAHSTNTNNGYARKGNGGFYFH